MNQRLFTRARGASQCDKIAKFLEARPGEWVPMPKLARTSGAYAVHSRIAALRERGLDIENRCEGGKGRVVKSFYRLNP